MNRKVFAWLLKLLKGFQLQAFLGSLLVALTIIFNIGLLATAAVLLTRAAFQPPILWLMTLIVGVRFFGIGRALLRYTERIVNHKIAFNILGRLRAEVYRMIEPLVPDPLTKGYDEGKLYNRIIGHIDVLQFFYLQVISVPVGAFIVAVSVGGFLLAFHPQVALIFIVIYALLAVLLPLWIMHGTAAKQAEINQLKDALTAKFFNYVGGIQDFQLADRVSLEQQSLLENWAQIGRLQKQIERKELWAQRLIQFVAHFSMMVVFVVALDAVRAGNLRPEYYPMLALVVLGSFEALQTWPTMTAELQASLASGQELYQFEQVEIPEKRVEGEHILSKDLGLQDISFNYHQDKRFIEDLQMQIAFKQKIAFVGLSGSGKSTVSRLIVNLWRPDAGHLELGETAYENLKDEFIWKNIGMLEQKPYFFHTSIRDNLLLANPKKTEEDLWAVLDAVSLKELVESLPQKLDTVIGDKGASLSGGEGQRLALARLILRNPDILILDEPYHGLDEMTKGDIRAFLQEWAKEKTVIYITHEFTGLEGLDYIYLFSHGKIKEQGNHQNLLKQDGDYAMFWHLEQNRL